MVGIERAQPVVFLVFGAQQVEYERGIASRLNCALIARVGFLKLEQAIHLPREFAERFPARFRPGLRANDQALFEMDFAVRRRRTDQQYAAQPAVLDYLYDVEKINVRQVTRQYFLGAYGRRFCVTHVSQLTRDGNPGVEPFGFEQSFVGPLEVARRNMEAGEREAVLSR